MIIILVTVIGLRHLVFWVGEDSGLEQIMRTVYKL